MSQNLLTLILTFAGAASINACGKPSETRTDHDDRHREVTHDQTKLNKPKYLNDLFANHPKIEDLPAVHEIKAILNETPQCPAELRDGPGNCIFDELTIERKTANESSLGQRVLVLDFGPFPMAYTRFHKRVLDYVEPDSSGWYQTTKKTLRIIRVLKRIYRDILGTKYPEINGGILPQVIDWSHESKYKNAFDSIFTRNFHGERVFSTIAEYSPQAEFVIAEAFSFRDIPNICQVDTDPKALRNFGEYLDTVVRSLKGIIEEHKIDFVNYSAGHTFSMANKILAETCGKSLPLDTIHALLNLLLEKFYRPLSSLPGLIFVQAGLDLNSKPKENDPDFITDCTFLPHRLRVHRFIDSKEALTSNASSLLSDAERAIWPCTDTFLRVQLEPELSESEPVNYSVLKTALGMFGFIPFTNKYYTPPSWMAPLATSHLIHLKKTMPAESTVIELLGAANNYGTEKMIDPTGQRQFEVFSLNILPVNDCDIWRMQAQQLGLVTREELWNLRNNNEVPLLSSDKKEILSQIHCHELSAARE